MTFQYPFYIITGGPGSGKSTLLSALKTKGLTCVDEVARDIIKEQESIGGDALHTKDQRKFLDLMLSRSLYTYRQMQSCQQPVMFDRGIPDLVGYCQLVGIDVPDYVTNAVEVYPYRKSVFIAPPWQEIYSHDEERKQDWQEAVKTYDCISNAYQSLGYDLIELPKASVDTRVNFVLDKIVAESK